MPKALPLAEVKATFSERVREVEHGQTLLITRHGKAVAALVPAEDYEHLQRLRAAGPESGLVSLAGGWEGSEELTDLLQSSSRSAPRPTAALD